MPRGLLIIDIQRDYFPGGANPLVGPDQAATVAQRVLGAFPTAGEPVVHLQHVWDAEDATFMRPGTGGVEIDPRVAPTADETVIEKAAPNGFLGAGLEQELRRAAIDEIVVVGMMSSMCVDATVRAAVALGYAATVVHDACAAPDLEFAGKLIGGETVHAAFMAALGDGHATVISSDLCLTA